MREFEFRRIVGDRTSEFQFGGMHQRQNLKMKYSMGMATLHLPELGVPPVRGRVEGGRTAFHAIYLYSIWWGRFRVCVSG